MKCFICKSTLIQRSFYINGQLTESLAVCNSNILNHSLEKHHKSYYINLMETDKSLEINLSSLTKFIYITEYNLLQNKNYQKFDMVNSFIFKKDEFKDEIYTDIINMLKQNSSISDIMSKIYKFKIFS